MGWAFRNQQPNLAALDCYEGYDQGAYDRGDSFEVFVETRKSIKGVYSYYRTGKDKGISNDKYRRVVLRGAEDCDLPDDYVAENL